MEENNNLEQSTQQEFKKPCIVENSKSFELFKLSEYILEKNYKLYIGAIIAMLVIQSIIDIAPINGAQVYVALLIGEIVAFSVSIFIIKKVKLDIESIDVKRQRGGLVKQIFFTLLVYLLVGIFFAVIAFGIAFVYTLTVGTSMETYFMALVGGLIMLFSLPLIIASVYLTCVAEALVYEIFAKNNVGFSAIKATFYNLHKSKNNTLTKLMLSVLVFTAVTIIIILINYAPLIQSASESTGLMEYLMMFVMNALVAIANVYFLTNRFIIYMSCRTE